MFCQKSMKRLSRTERFNSCLQYRAEKVQTGSCPRLKDVPNGLQEATSEAFWSGCWPWSWPLHRSSVLLHWMTHPTACFPLYPWPLYALQSYLSPWPAGSLHIELALRFGVSIASSQLPQSCAGIGLPTEGFRALSPALTVCPQISREYSQGPLEPSGHICAYIVIFLRCSLSCLADPCSWPLCYSYGFRVLEATCPWLLCGSGFVIRLSLIQQG